MLVFVWTFTDKEMEPKEEWEICPQSHSLSEMQPGQQHNSPSILLFEQKCLIFPPISLPVLGMLREVHSQISVVQDRGKVW